MGKNMTKEDKTASAKELLLADYKYLCDSFWKNEETGEKRVQFLITLVTAVLAAVVSLLIKAKESTSGDKDLLLSISLFSAAALLAFGVVTLFRIIKRNAVTDGYKVDMDEIRQRFKEHYDACGLLSGYEPFRGSGERISPLRKMGGLAYTVAAINSVLLAAISASISLKGAGLDETAIAGSSITVFAIGFAVQSFYLRITDRRTKEALAANRYSHAGGVVWKTEKQVPKFLIVQAMENKAHWVLPKGHIEKNETLSEAAIREVREETGVDARILTPVGQSKFSYNGKLIRVKFYLMTHLAEHKQQASEKREKKWCSYEEALSLLTFQDTREILRFAHCRVQEII